MMSSWLASPTFTDFTGKRAMGFYDDSDLPFYYFMASNFATSDRLFSPAPTRTHPNRFLLDGGHIQGVCDGSTPANRGKNDFRADG